LGLGFNLRGGREGRDVVEREDKLRPLRERGGRVPQHHPRNRAPEQLPCSEAGSYFRLIDSCTTQLKARGPSVTCNESKEEEEGLPRPSSISAAVFLPFFGVFDSSASSGTCLRLWGLRLSDTKVCEPEIRALLGTTAHVCKLVQVGGHLDRRRRSSVHYLLLHLLSEPEHLVGGKVVEGLWFRMKGSELGAQGLWFRVQGLGFRV